MRINYPYLKDASFLKMFDAIKNKRQFVKITVLDFNEKPIQSIEGRITGGSLNFDGSSSVRRSGNLSMVADKYENDLTNVDNLISINKKMELEIGFLNETNYYKDFDVIWMPLGIYVIMDPAITHDDQGVNISITLRDKMCLLNGECGGMLPASTTFSEYETVDETGQYVIVQPTIYQIIQELVNHFGGEPLGKIIISDLDTRVKKVMKWVGTTPLYLATMINAGTTSYLLTTNITDATEKDINKSPKIFGYGDDVGYTYTDFIFPGELIGDAGDSVCDILDQIKDTLGNYEYFYDINGNFVFQEIKNYLNTSQTTVDLNKLNQSDYLLDMDRGKSIYTFEDGTLIQSYSNAPQFSMIKNDFIVWGQREDINGNTFPIRYHLAIDRKPAVGNTYNVFFYNDKTDNLLKAKCPMIYETRDYFPLVGQAEVFYMARDTGQIYEWVPSFNGKDEDYSGEKGHYNAIALNLQKVITTDWRTELYLQGTISDPLGTDSNYYYTELKNEWPKLRDIQPKEGELKEQGFKEDVLIHPTDIDFFLDFIDSNAAISELSVSNIGRRQKVVVDDKVNCVFEPEIPDLVILDSSRPDVSVLRAECQTSGQAFTQVDGNIFSLLASGGKFNSAYNLVRELLYQYTSYNESIVLTTLPIFYLEPNTRITVRDKESGIYGDYMINSISTSFDIAATMTINCTRALDRI